MKIYLDVSSLNRPFDDQTQPRIRVETAAITAIFERIDSGQWQQCSSEMALIEIDATSDLVRFHRVRMLLPEPRHIIELSDQLFCRATEIEQIGFKPADAVHLAAAEFAGADVLLSCDDRLCRIANRRRNNLRVTVSNPVDWLKELDDANA